MRAPMRSRLQRGVDIALPVVVALFLASLVESTVDLPAALTLFGMAAGLVQGAALWWRRAHPDRVMLVTLAGGLVIQLVAPDGLFPYAGIVALFAFASVRPPRWSLPALAALLGVTAIAFAHHPRADVEFAMCFPVVAWALGEVARNRRAAIGEAARRAVTEEQARIARELHDVIAHSVSVIVVQAAAADDVFEAQPEQARRALRSIEGAGRDALAELRRLLDGVRPGGAEALHPQPGLDRLDELAASLRAAGLAVRLQREGSVDAPLPAGLELSAYRIVQEALTNTLRHAQATHAEVLVRRVPGMLELDISDDGRGDALAGARTNGGGHGIAGMRERAALLGGTLEARPQPGGGFRVHARLPIETEAG